MHPFQNCKRRPACAIAATLAAALGTFTASGSVWAQPAASISAPESAASTKAAASPGLLTLYFPRWLPHEYAHSWNGKFRRAADLKTPHFNVPMQNSLLWVDEGMTQYRGSVLTARGGWKLAFSELETDSSKRDEGPDRSADFSHSLGLQVTGNDNKLASVAGAARPTWRAWHLVPCCWPSTAGPARHRC